MIRFLRDGRYSIKMEFDTFGATELCKVFDLAIKNTYAMVSINPESSIEKGKQQKELRIVKNEENSKIYKQGDALIFELDTMSIEYGMDKLRECINNGHDFYPAEFCEAFLGKNNVTIYGFFVR
jgi:hypothetical protein